MAKKTKQPPMSAERAIALVRTEMKCWCSECDNETGEQCENAPTVTVTNTKFDTVFRWCAKHNPGKRHFADFVEPFEGGIALEFLRAALAQNGGAK